MQSRPLLPGLLQTTEAVIVSQQSYQSDEPYDIIGSNISFVNALFKAYLHTDEIAPDALRSYYVDYYLAQQDNGGFSQFVYNSRWSTLVVTWVREGLAAMGANQQLALFEESAALLNTLGEKRLELFLQSGYFDDNEERDLLNTLSDRFSILKDHENLVVLNATWLRTLPHLVVMTIKEVEAEVQRRSIAIPDREQRIARARANEPRYVKLIRALCTQIGHQLSRITAGDPTHVYAGQPTLAWHFITDQGHHYMVEAEDKALMFRGDTQECIAQVAAPDA
jgi:hypothetical protein